MGLWNSHKCPDTTKAERFDSREEKAAWLQESTVASRNWERQDMDLDHNLQREYSPADTLILA